MVGLSAAGLSVGYGKTSLLGPVSLHLPQGRLVALLGRNGSGKSTLLRSLAGLQRPLSGRIHLNGISTEQLSAREQARALSVVLTTPLTEAAQIRVSELVALGRHPYTNWWGQLSAEDQAKAAHAMQLTHTTSLAQRTISTLSDGQRQRVLIARALAQDTPLILLDEPTAHLDPFEQRRLFRLLHQLTRTAGKGILVATHAIRLTVAVADDIWLLDQQNLTQGLSEDLAYRGEISRVFFDNQPLTEGLTDPILAHPPREFLLQSRDAHWAFWTRHALQKHQCLTQTPIIQHPDGWQLPGKPPFERLSQLVAALT
ncbi:MAG: ABC transporter ATP-binding protein [Bernardetiaceae bacterium]